MVRLTSCIFGKNITEMTLCPSQSIISSHQKVHDIKMSYNWSYKPSSFRYHSVCQTASLKSSLLLQLINILWGYILRLWKYLVSHHIFTPNFSILPEILITMVIYQWFSISLVSSILLIRILLKEKATLSPLYLFFNYLFVSGGWICILFYGLQFNSMFLAQISPSFSQELLEGRLSIFLTGCHNFFSTS